MSVDVGSAVGYLDLDISGFLTGLQSAQTSNDDLRTLLDGFMNGGETTNFGTVMTE